MITNCRSCKSDDLKEVLSLGDQYLSDFIEPNDNKPPKSPLTLFLCRSCSLLQLGETVPSSVLYTSRYGYKSGISNTIREDLRSVVIGAVHRVTLQEGDCVVDIGSNDGTLLSYYPASLYRVGVEPIEKLARESLEQKRADFVINDFFNYSWFSKYLPNEKAKIITAISMFYDLDDPNGFVRDLVSILHPEGVIVIQQNYLAGMLKQHAFDNVVHEHLEYYSLSSLEKLLNRHGLEVFDVEENTINGGSFRTYIRHMDVVKRMRLREKRLRLDSEWTYMLFALKVRTIRKQLYEFIKREVEKGKMVYALGASTRGGTLLQSCGLDHTLIKGAMERNPEKWGKIMASTDIPIISEEQARKDKPDYLLVLPWFFADEIKKREAEYVKNGGALIFPLPKLEVYRG